MIQFQVTVMVEGGLHARPAALLVNRAAQSQSKITLNKGNKQADGRSILGIMTLGVSQGDSLTVRVEGSDEEHVAEVIQQMFTHSL
ncbi:HPr family phosphocarrier protein [Brevibacillus reuszeri]|uniref:HPr family phosphocarrier protein n=1 Tax=Brevibacillus reuszeri TaxID=54915 RepID=UPI002898DFF3|nr:HPr family phosphocarrier protein [Brevibacillus reuszeri]